MKPSPDLTWLFGILISILLSLVVYFVRLLHVDFRRMQKEFGEFKSGLELISQRVGQLEAKIKQFESFFYIPNRNEKE